MRQILPLCIAWCITTIPSASHGSCPLQGHEDLVIPEPKIGSAVQDILDLANQLSAVCSEAQRAEQKTPPVDASAALAYEEARRLREACQKIRNPKIQDITLNNVSASTLQQFRDNPITAEEWHRKWDPSWTGKVESAGALPGAMTGGLGIAQAAVVDGLTAFLIDRAQQELLDYMQSQLQSICQQTVSSCKVSDYMPSLCNAFKATEGEQSISMFSLGRTLRAAAIADLQSLPERAFFQLQSQASTQPKNAYVIARLIYAVGRNVNNGRDPFETIAGLETVTNATLGCNAPQCDSALLPIQKLGRYTRIVLPIINYIRSKENDSARSFNRYQLVASVLVLWKEIGGVTTNNSIASRFPDDAALVSDIFTTAKEIQAAIDLINRDLAKDDSGRAQRLADHWRRIITLATRLILAQTPQLKENQKVRSASRIIEQVITGDYSTALVEALTLIAGLGAEKESHSLARLAALGTELSGANSSDEVVTILKTAAAPPGGWKLKYRKQMVSITGFVGGGYYYDRIQPGTALPGQINEDLGFERSLYPTGILGIQYSYPLKYVHLGALLSLIDVGALARKKLSNAAPPNATVREENNVGFAQVFSPGVYLTVGLYKSMLTLGLGVSAVPELHSIDVTTGKDEMQETTTVEGAGIRVGGFLAVDVTILPF